MTSEFDTLSGIGYLAERNEKYKRLALLIAHLTRIEIESLLNISFEDWDLKKLYEEGEGEFTIFSWIDDIHGRYDHTEKWHGRLISWDLQEINDAIYKVIQGLNPHGLEKVLYKYPEVQRILIEFGSVEVGWSKSKYSKKTHYFINGTSICERGYIDGNLKQDDTLDKCKICMRKLRKYEHD